MKKTPHRKYRADVKVFEKKVHVVFTLDYVRAVKKYAKEHYENNDEELLEDKAACYPLDNGDLCLIFIPKYVNRGTIVHECVHAGIEICESRGVSPTYEKETVAYLIEHLYNRVETLWEKYRIKHLNENHDQSSVQETGHKRRRRKDLQTRDEEHVEKPKEHAAPEDAGSTAGALGNNLPQHGM